MVFYRVHDKKIIDRIKKSLAVKDDYLHEYYLRFKYYLFKYFKYRGDLSVVTSTGPYYSILGLNKDFPIECINKEYQRLFIKDFQDKIEFVSINNHFALGRKVFSEMGLDGMFCPYHSLVHFLGIPNVQFFNENEKYIFVLFEKNGYYHVSVNEQFKPMSGLELVGELN